MPGACNWISRCHLEERVPQLVNHRQAGRADCMARSWFVSLVDTRNVDMNAGHPVHWSSVYEDRINDPADESRVASSPAGWTTRPVEGGPTVWLRVCFRREGRFYLQDNGYKSTLWKAEHERLSAELVGIRGAYDDERGALGPLESEYSSLKVANHLVMNKMEL